VIVIPAPDLRERITALFIAADSPEPAARRVAESLVGNNLAGHDSHGVMMAVPYVRRIQDKLLNPHGEIHTVRESASTALLDCGFTFGQVAAKQGVELAMAKAAAHDIGVVVLRQCNHVGRLGEYVTMAAEQGYVGHMICNGPSPRGSVTPYGGLGRALGTNPIAWGIPSQTQPIVVDFATSVCAWGKIGVAMDKGEPIPEGRVVDREGRPTTDPHVLREGGFLLPFGEHKGYGLGVVVELLGGGLSGVGPTMLRDEGQNQGTVLTAINVEAFGPLDEFKAMVAEFSERLKGIDCAPGCDEVMVPGEPERRSRAEREQAGIPLPEKTWERLQETAASLGLAWE
jgi:LDH2 family malate/lactate/ureidoglycolate dehydrogenase